MEHIPHVKLTVFNLIKNTIFEINDINKRNTLRKKFFEKISK